MQGCLLFVDCCIPQMLGCGYSDSTLSSQVSVFTSLLWSYLYWWPRYYSWYPVEDSLTMASTDNRRAAYLWKHSYFFFLISLIWSKIIGLINLQKKDRSSTVEVLSNIAFSNMGVDVSCYVISNVFKRKDKINDITYVWQMGSYIAVDDILL